MTNMCYKVCNYDELVSSELMLSHAVTVAEAYVMQSTDPAGSTLTIRDASEKLVGSLTNKRIIGGFTRQIWGGRKHNDAIFDGEETFDATDYVLTMPYEHVLELRDSHESSDPVGTAHVEWDGPYEVDIVESICEYFGVYALTDITPEMFEFVRERVKPRKPEVREIEMTFKVRVSVNPGASLDEFLRDAQYSVESATNGVRVSSVKMTGHPQSGQSLSGAA